MVTRDKRNDVTVKERQENFQGWSGNPNKPVEPSGNAAPTWQNPATQQPTAPLTKNKTTTGGGSYTVNAGNQPYVDQLNSLYDQIMNRKPFQYDLNGDLLYRQIADRYTQRGQQAMRDTMGQAASLTGGYGNSYATLVGNQANQQYLTALNDNIPQLWDRAYQAYQGQGDQLMQQYQLAAAHPGAVEAIKPRSSSAAKETGTSSRGFFDKAFDRTKYAAALVKAGLSGSVAGAGVMQPGPQNQLNGIVYKYLEDQKKK